MGQRTVLRCVVASAVCYFHSGAARKGLKLMVENLQLNIQNEKTKDGCESLMRKSQRNILKKRRQGLQMLRTRREEALRDAEWGHI